MVKMRVAAVIGSVLLGACAAAQAPVLPTAQVYPERTAQVRALGQTMDPPAGGAPYRDAFGPSFWSAMTITRGIAFGSDPMHLLDVYMPDESEGTRRPVMVFVHGGGFRGGSRSGQPYPDNVPAWAAHHGMVGVSIDYRLAPDHPWPAGASDLAAALRWVRANIAEYGGDPGRIVLFGHSAGGNHVADYVAHPEVRGGEFAGVKGAILLSPNYPDALAEGAEPNVYYGTDAALQTARPQVERLRASGVPLFIGNAEYDPDFMQRFASQARDRLCETPATCPGYVRLADHNHFTEGMTLGTEDRTLSAPLLSWMGRIGVLPRR